MSHKVAGIAMGALLSGCVGGTSSSEGAPEGTPTIASAFEAALVGPLLEEVREGVRPFDDEGIGICAGVQSCDRYLGRTVDTPLVNGDYGLFASLRVPPIGEPGTWKVTLIAECKGEDGTAEPYNRTYDVVAPAGRTARPFRLLLQRITSPDPDGPRTCTWALTAPHPDREILFEGAWSTL